MWENEEAKVYYDQGTALYKEGNYDAAIEAFSRSIAKQEANKWAYDKRGSAYKSLRQYDASIRDYNRALELDNTFHNTYRNRAHAYRHMKLFQAAIADFERALTYDPDPRSQAHIRNILNDMRQKLS